MYDLVETPVDIAESLRTMHRGGEYSQSEGYYMIKHDRDLDRYADVISLGAVECVVETGTRTGASALWFSRRVERVITIDINPVTRIPDLDRKSDGKIHPLTGDSTDPEILAQVVDKVGAMNVLVSLDSSHTRDHVRTEIQMYSNLVKPGGFMVVEDGLFDYASRNEWRKFSYGNPDLGNPMDAIRELLIDNPNWERQLDIEGRFPVSHHPVGWWKKVL